MVVACVETIAEVKHFAMVCIVLLLQLQPSQFLSYSTAVLYILAGSSFCRNILLHNACQVEGEL